MTPLFERRDPRQVAWGESLSLVLWHLDPAALRKFAIWLSAQAVLLRDRARTQETRAKQHRAMRRQLDAMPIPSTPRTRAALREREKLALDQTIMRLARRGYSNEEIGRRVGRHPVTVSKAIGRILRPKTMADLTPRPPP